MKEWIDVNKEMPDFDPKLGSGDEKETTMVEIKLKDGTIAEAWYNTDFGWENWETEFYKEDVTHWRNID